MSVLPTSLFGDIICVLLNFVVMIVMTGHDILCNRVLSSEIRCYDLSPPVDSTAPKRFVTENSTDHSWVLDDSRSSFDSENGC